MQQVNCKSTSTDSLKSSTFHTKTTTTSTTTNPTTSTSITVRRIKTPGLTMNSFWTVCFFMLVSAYLISARPSSSNLNRFKRQSDQRIAELETLLALEKYGARRDMSRNDIHYPAYGIIDFAKIGRKKKSTRFSPGFVPEPAAENVMNVNQEPDLSDLTLPSGWFSKFEPRHPLHRRNPVGHDHFDTEK